MQSFLGLFQPLCCVLSYRGAARLQQERGNKIFPRGNDKWHQTPAMSRYVVKPGSPSFQTWHLFLQLIYRAVFFARDILPHKNDLSVYLQKFQRDSQNAKAAIAFEQTEACRQVYLPGFRVGFYTRKEESLFLLAG